ncbi:MAG: response regulator transcription factor [Gammaproteobacteria bacterium]|nr:response regulator transcription factor [Gammaproteobacteria bacterium]
MRVLIVEDEVELNRQLTERLRAEGYAVDSATTGDDGLYFGREYPIDVAVVDIGLPGISGIELISTLRREEHTFPILILTARSRWQEKVEGLEAGADDYLTKPFHYEELSARLRALIRRSAGVAESTVRAGPIALDTASQEVTVDGRSVEITAFEYRLLHYLVLNRNKVVSKSELVEHIYDEDRDRDSNVIEVFIGRLRKKLDPDGAINPIQTLRGRGYRLNPSLGD